MMLSKRSIKPIALAFYVGLLSFTQGCSTSAPVSAPLAAQKQTQELGTEILEMHQPYTDSTPIQQGSEQPMTQLTNGYTVYLAQEQQRLSELSDDTLKQYQLAIELMKQKQWSPAEQAFNAIISKHPKLAGAYINLALINLHQYQAQNSSPSSKLDNAAALLEQAIIMSPNNPYAYQVKGQTARLQGNFILAEQSYLQALSIWPDYPQAQLNLAILLELYRGQLLEAHRYYLAYLTQHTDDQQIKRAQAALELKISRAGLSLPSAVSTAVNSAKVKED